MKDYLNDFPSNMETGKSCDWSPKFELKISGFPPEVIQLMLVKPPKAIQDKFTAKMATIKGGKQGALSRVKTRISVYTSVLNGWILGAKTSTNLWIFIN